MTSKAQIIEETFRNIKCQKFEKGIIVSGFEEVNGQDSFTIKYYDEELNLVKKYSKSIEGELLNSQIVVLGKHIDVYIKAKPISYYLKFSDQLEEKEFIEVTPQVKLDDKSIIKNSSAVMLSYQGYYIGDDKLDFDLEKKVMVRYKSISSLKLDTWYSISWETPFPDFIKVKSSKIIYVDKRQVVAYLFAKGQDKNWVDCIIRLDAETGKIQCTIPITLADRNDFFSYSNAFYDIETGNTVVIGQIYNEKMHARKRASMILIYDKNGGLISSKKIEFQDHKIDAPNKFDLKKQELVAQNIGKVENGKYFVILENNCQKTVTGYVNGKASSLDYFVPIAYSYFEIDEKCNISNNKIKYINDFTLNSLTTPASGNEKFVLFKKAISHEEERKDDPNIVQVINFGANSGEMLQDVCEKDEYFQIICDDHHAILYRKTSDDSFYIRSVFIK